MSVGRDRPTGCNRTFIVPPFLTTSDQNVTTSRIRAFAERCRLWVPIGSSSERAELFSLFSSFDGDCQSGSFVIQRNRDKLSTRKFDVGVFTQAGSKTEKLPLSICFPLCP